MRQNASLSPYQCQRVPFLGGENLAHAAAAVGVQAPEKVTPVPGEKLLHVGRRYQQPVSLAEQKSRVQGTGDGSARIPHVRTPAARIEAGDVCAMVLSWSTVANEREPTGKNSNWQLSGDKTNPRVWSRGGSQYHGGEFTIDPSLAFPSLPTPTYALSQ